MKELIKYTSDIERLCSQYKVRRLYVFGSILTNRFSEDSDLDFIVDFEPIDITQYADNYYNLKFSLEDVFKKHIDLLEEQAVKNPYFRLKIEKQRQLIYGH